MKASNVHQDSSKSVDDAAKSKPAHDKKPVWETPKLEDVSEQVMAQPYIRFT
jgi:hypothetical protein